MFKSPILFAGAEVITKGIPYGLLIVASMHLNSPDYALLSIVVSLINIMASFVSFGSKEMSMTDFARDGEIHWEGSAHSNTIYILVGFIASLLLSIPACLIYREEPLSMYWFWMICAVNALFLGVTQHIQMVYSLRRENDKAIKLKYISMAPLAIGITFAQVISTQPGVSFSVSFLLTSLIILCFYLKEFREWVEFVAKRHNSSDLGLEKLRVAFLFGLTSTLGVGLSYIGQLVLAGLNRPNEAAILSICTIFVMVTSVANNALGQYFNPTLLSSKEVDDHSYDRLAWYYDFSSAVSTLIVVTGGLFVYFFGAFIWKQYTPSAIAGGLCILGAGFVMSQLSFMYRIILHKLAREIQIVMFLLISSSVSLVLLIVVTIVIRENSALYGTFVGYLCVGVSGLIGICLLNKFIWLKFMSIGVRYCLFLILLASAIYNVPYFVVTVSLTVIAYLVYRMRNSSNVLRLLGVG